uniref:Uncharacterized protein n=1 Tax=Amphimedon queenslandica TaxID=400682 RepID=A0A1X7VJC2_AMPQE
MAYVALSCVRTLHGLHLLSFNPLSVKVSNQCISESNRLRSKFWNDLPQVKKSKGKKRKIKVTGIIDDCEPCSKNAKVSTSNPKQDDNVISTNEELPNPDIQYELGKAIVSNMPNIGEEWVNSTLSATRYLSIYGYITKSKMYRNYVWATETEIITYLQY